MEDNPTSLGMESPLELEAPLRTMEDGNYSDDSADDATDDDSYDGRYDYDMKVSLSPLRRCSPTILYYVSFGALLLFGSLLVTVVTTSTTTGSRPPAQTVAEEPYVTKDNVRPQPQPQNYSDSTYNFDECEACRLFVENTLPTYQDKWPFSPLLLKSPCDVTFDHVGDFFKFFDEWCEVPQYLWWLPGSSRYLMDSSGTDTIELVNGAYKATVSPGEKWGQNGWESTRITFSDTHQDGARWYYECVHSRPNVTTQTCIDMAQHNIQLVSKHTFVASIAQMKDGD